MPEMKAWFEFASHETKRTMSKLGMTAIQHTLDLTLTEDKNGVVT
jgi:hypothetical protein